MKMAACWRNWPIWPQRATGGWAPIHMPTAGLLLHDLRMPDFHQHAVTVPSPGAVAAQDTMVLGKFLRDVAKLNEAERNFRIFGPDETLSNLLGAVFEVTNRQWDAREVPNDEFLAPFWTSAGLDAQRASVRGLAGRATC